MDVQQIYESMWCVGAHKSYINIWWLNRIQKPFLPLVT